MKKKRLPLRERFGERRRKKKSFEKLPQSSFLGDSTGTQPFPASGEFFPFTITLKFHFSSTF